MAKNNKRVSSKDVAREAGVSQSTVSRVFNDSGIPVSEDKKALVLETAARLGYRPSLIARSLNQQRTSMIGLLIRNFSNQFYIDAMKMFTEKFQEHGYTIMLFNIKDDENVEQDLIRAMEYQVDGLVITSASLDSDIVGQFHTYETPVILFNRLNEGQSVNAVCCDNVAGGEAVAEYLVSRGHKKLVYVAGEEDSSTNRDRKKGFFSYAKSAGLDDIIVVHGDFSYKSGLAAAGELIASGREFDGVFCPSDTMALGFMDYIHHKTDLSIPGDFSLVGFDGLPVPDEDIYPLTTYEQPLGRMVQRTVDFMIEKIENFSPDPVSYLFNGRILERGSVKDRN